MEFCPFFQSPDIITSHNPLSNITTHLGSLPLFSHFSPPSISMSITHLFSVWPAGQVHVKLMSGERSAPCS